MSGFRFLRAGLTISAAAAFAVSYAASGPNSILPEFRIADGHDDAASAHLALRHAGVASPLFAAAVRDRASAASAVIADPMPPAVAQGEEPAPTAATTTDSGSSLLLMKPLTTVVRAQPQVNAAEIKLAADIQRHLRRLGCYTGPASGGWDADTRAAMARALDAMNAKLPVKGMEVSLLALVEAQPNGLCERGPAAPRTETAATTAAKTAPFPGMMSVGGPQTEGGAPSTSPAPGASVAQGTSSGSLPAAAQARLRPHAARKPNAASRASDSFFTHPLSRQP